MSSQRFPNNQPLWVKEGKVKHSGIFRKRVTKNGPNKGLALVYFPGSQEEAYYPMASKLLSLRKVKKVVQTSDSESTILTSKKRKSVDSSEQTTSKSGSKRKVIRKTMTQEFKEKIHSISGDISSGLDTMLSDTIDSMHVVDIVESKMLLAESASTLNDNITMSSDSRVRCHACQEVLGLPLKVHGHRCVHEGCMAWMHSHILCPKKGTFHCDMEEGKYYCHDHLPGNILLHCCICR